MLQGDYTSSELREAQKALPTDSDEYSDCRDVLSRALAPQTTRNGNDSGGTSGGGGGGGGGSGGGGGDGTSGSAALLTPAPPPRARPRRSRRPRRPSPSRTGTRWPQARDSGGEEMEINGRAVSPGEARLAADVGRNSLPGTLIAVLALLAAATLVVPWCPSSDAVAAVTRRRRSYVAPPGALRRRLQSRARSRCRPPGRRSRSASRW